MKGGKDCGFYCCRSRWAKHCGFEQVETLQVDVRCCIFGPVEAMEVNGDGGGQGGLKQSMGDDVGRAAHSALELV